MKDAEAMVRAADASCFVAACGFSYRRSPAVGAISEQIKTAALGESVHGNGRYWCDYSADPDAPTSWRYKSPLGSGTLADLGGHLLDLSEQLCWHFSISRVALGLPNSLDRSRAEAFAAQRGVEKFTRRTPKSLTTLRSRWSATRSSTHCTPSGTSTH